MIQILINIAAFIIAVSILVTFHEFGHFGMARLLGVKVLQFSIGFGKSLFKFKKNDTEYVIAAIPLGGYVKMLDEREGDVSEQDKPYAFNRQPLWVRFLIILAGPVANFIFAIFAYWIVYMVGIEGVVPIVGEIVPQSIASKAGMVAIEEIIAVDNMPTKTWTQVYRFLMERLGSDGTLEIRTLDHHQVKNYRLNISNWELKGSRPEPLHSLGILALAPPISPQIVDVLGSEPAAQAGVKVGDLITEVNDQPITDWKQFTKVVTRSINQEVVLTIKRDGETRKLTFKPRAKEIDTGEIVGFAGLVVKSSPMPKEYIRAERLNPVEAFLAGIRKTGEFIALSFKIIGKMLTGQLGLKTLSGPISIAQGAGETAMVGFQYYLAFLALISISLGVLNLLPIPILDGGHLLYCAIELISGKPVSPRAQAVGFQIGMLLLIFLMSVAFYNDIVRLF